MLNYQGAKVQKIKGNAKENSLFVTFLVLLQPKGNRMNAKELNLKEFFKGDRFAALAGIELMEIGDGYGKARMLITPEHLNGGGFCQGGALFTLADLAFAAAVNSHNVLTVSTSSNITYVRSVKQGYVYAEAHELINHHRMPYAEVIIKDEDGETVAIFTSSGYRKGQPNVAIPK